MNAKQLYELGENQFGKRLALMQLWQEIAENFYPERADFTFTRSLGTDFGAGMMTSYPFLCRRDLGDQLGMMLRSNDWFEMVPIDAQREDVDSKQWLQWAAGVQRRAMYDRVTQLTRATKATDHDFAAFGQGVMTIEMNYKRQALLYRNYHLRDVTWTEDESGAVGNVFRKWKPQVRDLGLLYPNTIHPTAKDLASRQPFEKVNCFHMVVDAEMYTGDSVGPHAPKRGKQPRYLICYDADHDAVLEAVPIWGRHYIIPRWETPGQSQFAYSPASVAALADARLIQAMTLTLLEAGEKITNPPMVATQEAVRSDIDIAPGGITWVDIEYDERLGDALRPLTTDAKGMPLGIDMQRDSRQMIMQAFFLNKIAPPLISKDPRMTAFQAGQIIQQWIREALPIFEPVEQEYNGALCEETFGLLMRNGAFGDLRELPESLQGADLEFRFKSPLHDVVESQKGQKFLEMKQLAAEAIALDPSAAYIPDVITAFRDAMNGIGVPAAWQRAKSEVDAMVKQASEKQQAAALLENMKTGSEAARNLAAAGADNAAAAAPAV